MPYKNNADKIKHNKEYKEANDATLTLNRILKSKQKSITQVTADKLLNKGLGDKEFWLNIKIQKSLKQQTEEHMKQRNIEIEKENEIINKETEKAITKTSYPVQKVFDHINISQKSKPNNIKTYTSRSKVLVRLLCGDSNDFMCIYKKTNVKIIEKAYPDGKALAYVSFMLKMIDSNPEIKERVTTKMREFLVKEQDRLTQQNTARGIRSNDQHMIDNDYDEQYKEMHDKTYTTNKQKLVEILYLHSIYDKKGKLIVIPRNYYHNTQIITSPREVIAEENYYNKKTGTFYINNFKTKTKYEASKYQVSDDIKNKINKLIGNNKYLFTDNNSNLSAYIKLTLGFNINHYRKIMKAYFMKTLSREDIARSMKNSVATGKAAYGN